MCAATAYKTLCVYTQAPPSANNTTPYEVVALLLTAQAAVFKYWGVFRRNVPYLISLSITACWSQRMAAVTAFTGKSKWRFSKGAKAQMKMLIELFETASIAWVYERYFCNVIQCNGGFKATHLLFLALTSYFFRAKSDHLWVRGWNARCIWYPPVCVVLASS